MLEKLPKMSARQMMIALAGRPPAYGEQPRWLSSLAKRLKLSERTVRSLWNNEISDPNHRAIQEIRRALEIAEAKKEAAKLAHQYRGIAGGMRAQDENFYRTEIDRLERLVRIIGGLDSAGDYSD